MRLTLRTMLAYMDDVLEPADADDVRQKIEGSKFATDLGQRIRDCVRLLRLPAPPLQGRGLGMDPNSVAEYLNYTLPDDRVPDFEKICLESDTHLAEVAACHQILALVLSEPADVDPVAREHMYALIDKSQPDAPPPQTPVVGPPIAEAPARSAPATGPPMSTAAASAVNAVDIGVSATRRPKPEVPDYLRETRSSRFWPVAAVLLIAFVLTSGILAMVAPPELRELASGWFGGDPSEQAGGAGSSTAPEGSTTGPGGSTTGPGGSATAPAGGSAPNPSGAGEKAAEPAAPVKPDAGKPDTAQSDAAKPGAASADVGLPEPRGPRTAGSPGPRTAGSPGPRTAGSREQPGAAPALTIPDADTPDAGSAAAENMTRPTGDPALPATVGSQVDPSAIASSRAPESGAPLAAGGAIAPGSPAGRPEVMPDQVAPDALPPAPDDPRPAGPAAGPAGPAVDSRSGADIGRYSSDQDVLLKLDPASGAWRRLPAKSAIASGDLLMSLPAYRPIFNLVTGLSVQAVGPSEFQVQGLDPQGVPVIAIRHGRLIALTNGKAGERIRLDFGDRAGLVTFGDTSSALAIDVEHVLTPGVDPETEIAPLFATLFATSGSIRWEENGRAETIQAPAGRSLAPLPIAELAGAEAPKWVTSDGLSPIDKRGADVIEKELAPDRSISLALKELSENRRTEVRTLATRCAGYVGQFEPFVAALNDADQRGDWPKHIEALRAAVARGPETAALVRAAFEKHRGGEAAHLYRMLWGYTPEQLKDGAALELVEGLNSESLDVCVLSFWNLQKLTGLSLYYKPEYPPAKRRPAYLKWKERLREGKIVSAAKVSSRTAHAAAENPEP